MAEPHAIFVVPTAPGVGLTSVCLGLVRRLELEGLRVGFSKPIRQPGDDRGPERSTEFVRRSTHITPPEPMPYRDAEGMMAAGKTSELLQELVGHYQSAAEGAGSCSTRGCCAQACTSRPITSSTGLS